MRKSLESTPGSPVGIRIILLSCLLTIYFEFLCGGYTERKAVYSQIAHGVKLLENWSQNQRLEATTEDGLSSPAPSIIENDLYQAFVILDIKSMYVLNLYYSLCLASLQK